MTRTSASLTRLSVMRSVSAAARSLREPGQREFSFKTRQRKALTNPKPIALRGDASGVQGFHTYRGLRLPGKSSPYPMLASSLAASPVVRRRQTRGGSQVALLPLRHLHEATRRRGVVSQLSLALSVDTILAHCQTPQTDRATRR